MTLLYLSFRVENGREGETGVRETNDYSIPTTNSDNSFHLLNICYVC